MTMVKTMVKNHKDVSKNVVLGMTESASCLSILHIINVGAQLTEWCRNILIIIVTWPFGVCIAGQCHSLITHN